MLKAALGVLAAFWLTQIAVADTPGLTIVGGGVTWTADANPFCQFVLRIKSGDTPCSLAGWQLNLEIVPDTGQVWFSSIAEPDQYVFDEEILGITATGLGTTKLVAMDDIFASGTGAEPVDLTGANLLQIGLMSSQAVGHFDIRIVATEQDFDSVWYSETGETKRFENFAESGKPYAVVESLDFISAPEPSTLVFLLSAAAVTAFGYGRCRTRR
jgi:hypothetical protein